VRRLIPFLAVAVLAALLWLWGLGGADRLAQWAASGQREVQETMAHVLRRLKSGDPQALAALWALCFGYGFFHAAGPGHGKLVIGAVGLGRRVTMLRLAGLAVASSLAQAVTAVALVGAGILVLDWSRERMQLFADQGLAVLSAALIGAVGAWLLWRGMGSLRKAIAPPLPPERAVAPRDPAFVPPLDGFSQPCASCGHAHGPSLHDAERVRSWREAAAVVGAIAARPCTGALFLLILTWRMGLFSAGVAGAFAMALGTATVTVAVAAGSVLLREGALMRVGSAPALARALGAAEMLAGALVLAVAWALLRQAL
jgi:nickel/cobalt exporter